MKRNYKLGIGLYSAALAIGLFLAGCGGGGGGTLPYVPNSLARTCVAPGTAARMASATISPYAGHWTGTFTAGASMTGTMTMLISNDGGSFSGSVSGTHGTCGAVSITFAGTISGNTLTFTSFSGADGCGTITGSLAATGSLSGTAYISISGTLTHSTQGSLSAGATLTPRQSEIQCIQINTSSELSLKTVSVTSPSTQNFFVTVYDNDCNPMAPWSTVSWSADATIGSISSTGVFTPVNTSSTAQGYVYATFGGKTDSVLVTLNGDTVAPTVTAFSPISGATNVTADGPTFKAVFSESMDSTVNLNSSATLAASGFTITMQRADTGGAITINSSNALSYGTFSWMTTTLSNDTLAFTLMSSATLTASGLRVLEPGRTYNITAWTAPSNVKDLSGNAVSTTGLSATGSFTASEDTTAPAVSSFWPSNGATNVVNDQPQFRVYFNETMDHTVGLNNSATLTAPGFSITLEKVSTGATLTIDASNALSYGSFGWTTTTYPMDTLRYVLKSNATLASGGLKTIDANTTYNITSRTVPGNLTDQAGNALSTTGIPATGSFKTQP